MVLHVMWKKYMSKMRKGSGSGSGRRASASPSTVQNVEQNDAKYGAIIFLFRNLTNLEMFYSCFENSMYFFGIVLTISQQIMF